MASLDFSSKTKPVIILVFSGKRKSGKDHLAESLQVRLGSNACQVLRLSGPLKKQYALENGLDYEKLLNATSYKEQYRALMIKWGEDKREKEPYFFCSKTVEEADRTKPVWIVSDARRKTDVQFFKENYTNIVSFVRITAFEQTRKERGFVFTPGIDDAESECGLDTGVEWDFLVDNDNNSDIFDQSVNNIVQHVETALKES